MLAKIILSMCLIPVIIVALSKIEKEPLHIIYHKWPFYKSPKMSVNMYESNHYITLTSELKNISFSDICNKQQLKYPVGHIHIYVNGQKYKSMFYPVLSIPKSSFKSGENIITAILQAPDHRTILYNNRVIYKNIKVNL